MKWKNHITVRKENGNWYLKDGLADCLISVDAQYIPLMELIESGVEKDIEIIHRLMKEINEDEVIIGCMVAEFYIEYAKFLEHQKETEIKIEV